MLILLQRLSLCLLLLSIAACEPSPTAEMNQVSMVKNIILMIGDGMGPQQVGLLENYARRAPNSIYEGKPTGLSQLMQDGKVLLSDTGPHNALVVDSACSATQLAIGQASSSEMIGLDHKGNKVETVLQLAKRHGKSTGLVSDTRITHATPASFAAHQPHRSYENEIAQDLLSNQVDVLLSGGLRYFLPNNISAQESVTNKPVYNKLSQANLPLKSKRQDTKDLLLEAETIGYSFAFNQAQLDAITQPPLLGLFASSGMEDAIEYHSRKASSDGSQQPSLKQMTLKALELLSQNSEGFFLMVEGGQIDWAGHNNDAGSMLHELLRFDEAVQAVYEWVSQREDTLVVVTADHETGSFGFSYSAENIPDAKPLQGDAFKGIEFAPNFNFAGLDVLDGLYQQKKDFYGIWQEASEAGENGKPAVLSLVNAVNNNMAFKIDEQQAKRILARHKNPYKKQGHKYLDTETLPHVHDFTPFYVYGDDIHLNLLAREVASSQNTVWGTGTHTATPVPVILFGPDAALNQFEGFLNHSHIGKTLKDIVVNK